MKSQIKLRRGRIRVRKLGEDWIVDYIAVSQISGMLIHYCFMHPSLKDAMDFAHRTIGARR